MRRAIALARNGIGFVNPNPLVGAVVVKDGRIIGEGWHAKYGDLHAERHALKNCTESPQGADLYVTLEPCCHHGKQPPCTDAVIEAGIRRVFVGSYDPNPLVSGKSSRILKNAGIEVHYELLSEECDALNPFFFYYMKKKLPYVICKYAMSADGKIACKNGDSKWVTGEAARAHVQETRRAVSAILVGIGTVLADNPSLLCHGENPSHPVRVVCDTHLRIPEDCTLVNSTDTAPVVIMTCSKAEEKIRRLTEKGVTVCIVAQKDGHTDLADVLKKLGEMGLDSVLIEGGAQIHAAALKTGMVCQIHTYIAPKLIGGDGLSPVSALEVQTMKDAVTWDAPKVQLLGQDVLLIFDRKGASAE